MPKTPSTEDRLPPVSGKVDQMLDRRAIREKAVKAHLSLTASEDLASMIGPDLCLWRSPS